MSLMYRIRIPWSGTPLVGPSISTFFAGSMPDGPMMETVKTFFEAIKGFIPEGANLQYPSSGEVLESTTGKIMGLWTGLPGTSATLGGGPKPFAAGVGLRVRWLTSTVHRGRVVKGSTYVVPISSQFYTDTGVVSPGNIATLYTAANLLQVGADLGVWSRPKKGGNDGLWAPIDGVVVPDVVSWLRSRRT